MAAKEMSSTTSSGRGKCSMAGVFQREYKKAARIARCSTMTTASRIPSQNSTLSSRLYGLVSLVPIAASSTSVILLTAVAPVMFVVPSLLRPVLVTTRRSPGKTLGKVPLSALVLLSVVLVSYME